MFPALWDARVLPQEWCGGCFFSASEAGIWKEAVTPSSLSAKFETPGFKMDKVCAIFGGSRGIGRAVAQLMAQKGYRLAIIARNLEVAKAAASDLGGRYWTGVVQLCGCSPSSLAPRLWNEQVRPLWLWGLGVQLPTCKSTFVPNVACSLCRDAPSPSSPLFPAGCLCPRCLSPVAELLGFSFET